jgi:hypothetical protein
VPFAVHNAGENEQARLVRNYILVVIVPGGIAVNSAYLGIFHNAMLQEAKRAVQSFIVKKVPSGRSCLLYSLDYNNRHRAYTHTLSEHRQKDIC